MNTETAELQTLELVETPQAAPRSAALVAAPQSPMGMLMQATANGMSPDTLERMWALQVKFEEREAEKAMTAAMAAFKLAPPKIMKDKLVSFTGAKGTTEYMHATHYAVTSAIVAGLALHGISHRWDTEQTGNKIAVTCVLTHKLGHSISVRLEATADGSGGKNEIQAIMSAKSYLERHTLLAATGMSTADHNDDDGRAAGGAVSETVVDAMLAQLHATNNDMAAAAVWATGSKAIGALGNPAAYDEFKQAVVAHRKALKAQVTA